MILGLGPGGRESMTVAALDALEQAQVIVGYRRYVQLLPLPSARQEVLAYEMTQELERARQAVALAGAGRRVVVVSGGDPGVYGMAGLVLEVLAQTDPQGEIPVRVIPGVTAATAAAALLGAPLNHDFAVISLSDRLTPWDLIARRLEMAARGDFVIVLYNPRSQGRPTQLRQAGEILLRYRSPATPVGVVRNAGREGEEVWLSDLRQFTDLPVDMLSTVIIGNSQTKRLNSRLVTPRGYRL